MVIAYHAVFAARGFWPPNDPRESWSDKVWAEHLKPFGQPNKVSTRRSLAHVPHDREKARQIKSAMLHPPVQFNHEQRRVVVDAFGEIIPTLRLKVYACAILPDHVHLVAHRNREEIETIIGYLKRAATRKLKECGIHPLSDEDSTPWVRGGWKRYIDNASEIPGAMDYVNGNFRARMPEERYSFLTPFVWYGECAGASRRRDG